MEDIQVICIARILSQCDEGGRDCPEHGCWWMSPSGKIILRATCPHKNDGTISRYLVQMTSKQVVTYVDEVTEFKGKVINS
jgi:hypothetical protein